MTVQPIYLDHHATTPVDPRVVVKVMATMTENFGNASSVEHLVGDRSLRYRNYDENRQTKVTRVSYGGFR